MSPRRRRDPFATSDLNKDGKIDRAEYQRRMVEVFYFADKNKDGVVTVEEIAAIETVDEAAFKKADKNGDGSSPSRVRHLPGDPVRRSRHQRDGVLTVEEVKAWEMR